MIPSVTLVRTSLRVSRLAYGTSRLHYCDRHRRADVLAAAFDAGITYFDTAPIYGDGLAERALGEFARLRRDRMIIATKYGIAPNPVIDALPRLGHPFRIGRAVARRAGWRDPPPASLTGEGLKRSVEASLRRLNTDYLDAVLLHEPDIGRVPDMRPLAEQAQALAAAGKVRFFGLAGHWRGVAATFAAAPQLGRLIQCPESEWNDELVPDLTYSVLTAAPQSYFVVKPSLETIAQRMRSALDRRAAGAIIVSSTNPGHIEGLATLVASEAV